VHRVNILGEALDGLGRRYVAVAPFLIIGFVAALFFLTGAGQARLQEASAQLQKIALREHYIDQLQVGVSRAVATQRGFLLTGDGKYLKAYDRYVADVEPVLARLQSAYTGSDSDLADMRTLHVLIGKRLVDLAMIAAIQKSQGTAAAIALVKTSVGSDTGEAINDILEQMRDRESAQHRAAEDHWSGSLALSRWITVAGTIFNMLLVGAAARLVYLDMRRRTRIRRPSPWTSP
jgi:CHASE3 domain sensor protein